MTMERYIRQAKLTAGGVTLETTGGGLHMAWQIRQDADSSSRNQILRIYNMPPEQADALSEMGLPVTLEAGYEGLNGSGAIDLIFDGEITRADNSRLETGRQLMIRMSNADEALQTSNVARTLERPMLTQLVQLIVGDMGLEYDGQSAKVLPMERLPDYAYIGPARHALDALLLPRGIHWYVIEKQVRFYDGKTPTVGDTFMLNEDTGLRRTPTRIIGGMRAAMIMNPDIQIGQMVNVESDFLSGQFLVYSYLHHGDTRQGAWHTEIAAAEV